MLTIGRLAKQTQVSTDSIRFYQREGLIEPTTTSGAGYRLYSEEAARTVEFIKHAQRCGFSLAEIKALLHARNPEGSLTGEFYRVARKKQADIEETMTALKSMSLALSAVLQRGVDEHASSPGSAEASPLLAALDARTSAPGQQAS
jgi:MerR family Zn(II)-responsive transcriptional regulator of zntA